MAMNINTNIASITAQRNLSKTSVALAKNMAKISSGLRINQSSDDAAGLAIAIEMSAEIYGLQQAERNAYDGISALQTADGAMGESTSILQRMRELAVQGANGLNSDSSRAAIQTEFEGLQDELDRIGSTTSFNGTSLLDGSFNATLQVGPDAGETLEVSVGDQRAEALGLGGIDLSTQGGASSAIDSIDAALQTVSENRSRVGAMQNRLDYTISNLSQAFETASASRSRILDADFAQQVAGMTQNQILQQAGIAALTHANAAPQAVLSLLK